MALAAVHAGLALLACGLGVSSFAPIASATAAATASLASLLHLVEAFIDDFEDDKDGVLVVGGEIVRHVCGRLIA